MAERRTFTLTVLVGLGAAALTAAAAHQPWSRGTPSSAAGPVTENVVRGSDAAPLVLALALVLLAAWAVVLVVRRRARRLVAVVGVIGAAGVLVSVLAVAGRLPDLAVEDLGSAAEASTTVWPVVAGLGAVLTGACFVLALLRAPSWPEMDSRYDAPGRPAGATAPAAQEDLWRALDEGRDPTL